MFDLLKERAEGFPPTAECIHCLTIVSGIMSGCDFWTVADYLSELDSGSIPTVCTLHTHRVHPRCLWGAPCMCTACTPHTHTEHAAPPWHAAHVPMASWHVCSTHPAHPFPCTLQACWDYVLGGNAWGDENSHLCFQVPHWVCRWKKKQNLSFYLLAEVIFFLEAAKAQSTWKPQRSY